MNPQITLDQVQEIFNKYGLEDHQPKDIEVYRRALREKSVADNQLESYERLEFIGDSLLNHSVLLYIYNRFPDELEGFLTKLKIKIVRKETLSYLAETLGIKKYIQIDDISRLEDISILEDVFESFIGAIYVDIGDYIDDLPCKKFVLSIINQEIDLVKMINQEDNYKEKFQNYYYKIRQVYPSWIDLDPVHNKEQGWLHTVGAKDANGAIIGVGYGKKKVDAAQQASKNALKHLGIKCNLDE